MNPLDMYIAVQTELDQVFIKKIGNFSAHNPKNNIGKVLRVFSSNFPCRYVELILDSLYEVSVGNPKLFLLKGVKSIKEKTLRKIFFSNCSRGPCSSDNSAKNLSPNSDNYCSESQNKKNSFHLAKTTSRKSSSGHIECCFDTSAHIFSPASKKHSPKVWHWRKTAFFKEKSLSLKFSSGKNRMTLQYHCLMFYSEVGNLFAKFGQKREKIKLFSSKWSSEILEGCFDL